MVLETNCRRYEVPRRGQTSSQDFNDFQDLVVGDVRRMVAGINSNTDAVEKALQVLVAETRANREEIERLKNDAKVNMKMAASLGEHQIYFQDWRRTRDIDYGSISDARKVRVNTVYGQATIPFNDVMERFFYKSLDTDKVVTDPGVTVEVTSVDEAGAAQVVTGTTSNAFNGVNESYWVREVLYDPKEDVDAVQCAIQASVPTSRIITSNMLVIHPYPIALVDVVEILYSLDSTDPSLSFSDLYPEATFPINNASFLRFVFPPLDITKIKVVLRQRAFSNRNGYKSFQYGLQELSLRLIDYDKTTYDPASSPLPTDVNSVITVVECAEGYVFKDLMGFWSLPAYATLTGASESGKYGWPIYYRIYSDSALTDLLWDSYNNPLPQDTSVSVSAKRVSKVYVVVSTAFDTTKAVPPIIDYFALKYTTET